MRLLAAALLLAAPSSAEVLIFDAGRDPRAGILWSGDAYHYAFLDSSGDEEKWIVDGKVRWKGPPGTFAGPATLSANGSTLLHGVAARDKAGADGVAAAINGRKAGGAFPEMEAPLLSARGGNAAYAIKVLSFSA